MTTPNARFKSRLLAREHLLGAFIKTPHPITIEIMGTIGFDFLVLDGEHGPFGRGEIDACMIAGRATGCPLVVRVPDDTPSTILNVLDAGAAGVVVPHVGSAEQAERLARAMHYGPHGRGFTGTSRAADYARRSLTEHKALAAQEVVLMCQIEDSAGVEAHREIADTPGVDALFIGRADLAVDAGVDDFFAPEVSDITQTVLGAQGCTTGLFCPPTEDLTRWRDAGGSFFVIGSDHSLMAAGAAALRSRVDALSQ